MSKYKEIQTSIKNQEHIIRALAELGKPYEVAEAGQTLSLVGYEGRIRPEQAQVVVRRQYVGAASNDLGWALDPETGTYKEIISEYDASTAGARIAQQVRQKAAYYQLEELAMANGYTLNIIQEHGMQRVQIGGLR